MFPRVILFSLLIIANVNQSVKAEEYYTTKYKLEDVDRILKNERLMKNFFDCILDKGKCTPDGRKLKSVIPDALRTECAKCNDQHKEGAKRVIKFIVKNKPEWWRELLAKFDPSGEYKNRYNKFSKEEGLDK